MCWKTEKTFDIPVASHHSPFFEHFHWCEWACQDRGGLLNQSVKSLPVSGRDAAATSHSSIKDALCHNRLKKRSSGMPSALCKTWVSSADRVCSGLFLYKVCLYCQSSRSYSNKQQVLYDCAWYRRGEHWSAPLALVHKALGQLSVLSPVMRLWFSGPKTVSEFWGLTRLFCCNWASIFHL